MSVRLTAVHGKFGYQVELVTSLDEVREFATVIAALAGGDRYISDRVSGDGLIGDARIRCIYLRVGVDGDREVWKLFNSEDEGVKWVKRMTT